VLSVARAAGVRAGEGRILALAALLFAALEAGRGFGEVGVDTLVVSRLGTAVLPYLFIGLGATSLVAALAYGAVLGRVSRTPLLAGILLVAAGLLIVGWLAISSGIAAAVPLTWLLTNASLAIATTIAWTVAGSVFDARQSKRLFPLCIGAAIAGNFVGSLSSGVVAGAVGTEALVVLEAIMLAIVGLLIVAIARTGRVRLPPRQRPKSVIAEVRTGFDEVVRSPLFRLVAVAYVLFSILMFSVNYPFLQAATAAFPREADLAAAIGLLSAAVTATSFIVSLTIANRVYARFGVAGAALVLPLVYAVGFCLWLVQFSFATAAAVRFSQQVAQRGISNAAWSAFYNVVPTERRAQVLAFIDGVPGQLGMILAGLLLLGAGRVFAADQVFWLGLIAAVALTVVVVAIRRRYGASLLRTLRAGMAERVLEGGPGLAGIIADPQVDAVLTHAARAPEAAVRRMAVTMLARTSASRSAAVVGEALDDEDAGVRAAALAGFALLQPDGAARQRIIDRLGDDNPVVRAAAVRAVDRTEGDRVGELLEPLAGDASTPVRSAVAVALDRRDAERAPDRVSGLMAAPEPGVREAVLDALAAADARPLIETLMPTLLGALDDDSTRVRRAAAGLIANCSAPSDGLIEILTSGTPRAQDAALAAMLGHGEAVREEVLAWATVQIGRASTLRSARWSLASDAAPASPRPDSAAGFLASVLERRERALADRALGALAVLGAPEARGVIRRCLGSDDPEIRAQALEALDSIGDRRLSSAVVRLLDADGGGAAQARHITLAQLADDDDAWVATLARRTIADEGGAGQMPDTERTIGDIDTMLTLRRVPLFEGLEPEDLQRIAATCIERAYPVGEALVREGDLGDELLVIVEGTVRVVRIEPDGSERLIRRYEAGDHIGELAVLRERPRAATVIAEGDGVRALVIGGTGLTSILRERPDAAMAMLATLAERISRQ
jgi:HEAT repeat protein